eukprot:GFKZ01013171.1.p1 GENE.GFKZ01013171.1~~GFKZ01013171.1.p1  ORF type:complete len:697 (-),score=152.48 GFKZ01013171.1:460-2550(-)
MGTKTGAATRPKRSNPESSETDPRFASSAWDPRFSRVPKRAKRAIDDERFSQKLKASAGFRGSRAPVDRFGRRKVGRGRLDRSLRELAEGSDEEDGEDGEVGEGIEVGGLRVGGNSNESESESESEDDEEFVGTEGDEELEEIPRGQATRRVAVVGLDWSTTRAVDIYASLSCFCPPGKRIEYVEVHPSKFGLQRLAVEAKFGPQVTGRAELRVVEEARERNLIGEGEKEGEREVGSEGREGSDDEDAETRAWRSQEALRKYEEERLRYYYGVVQFEDVKSADAVYEQCDGVEYSQSGRAFDLRFIPEGMVIETKPRDRADCIPDRYKPPSVVPSTLNNSNVKMSWDADDPDRVILKKKTMGKHDLDEENLKAYLAGSSDEEVKPSQAEVEKKKNLLLGELEQEENEDGGMDMEVTFDPGMLEKGEEIVKRKHERDQRENESEWEARLRRQEERKAEKRRKWREMAAAKAGEKARGEGSEEEMEAAENPTFDDDPFFSVDRNIDEAESEDDQGAAQSRKGRKKNINSEKARKGAQMGQKSRDVERQASEVEDQGKVGVSGSGAGSIRDQLAEADSYSDEDRGKRKGGRGRKSKAGKSKREAVSAMDTKDSRFQGLFQSHLYAMDPTHPKFRGDDTSKAILQEQASRSQEIGKAAAANKQRTAQKGVDSHTGNASEAMQLVERLRAKLAAKRRAKRR